MMRWESRVYCQRKILKKLSLVYLSHLNTVQRIGLGLGETCNLHPIDYVAAAGRIEHADLYLPLRAPRSALVASEVEAPFRVHSPSSDWSSSALTDCPVLWDPKHRSRIDSLTALEALVVFVSSEMGIADIGDLKD